jgi:anti-sigma regulatory factor (Ser/Thr protein kinase)
MSYAYPPQTKGEISVEARSDGKVLRFIITDVGVAFDPTQVLRADTTLPIEERPIGGLGILLMREMMDTINYERVNGKNILTLIKIINH